MHCNFLSRWKVFLDFWDIPSQSQPPQYTWHDIAELNYAVEVTPRSQTLNSFHSNAKSRKQKPHGVMPTAESDSAVGMPQLSHTHWLNGAELKGQSIEIFYLHFYHYSNLPGPLTNELKYFWFWLGFRGVIQILGYKIDSPGYDTPARLTCRDIIPQGDWLNRVHIPGRFNNLNN